MAGRQPSYQSFEAAIFFGSVAMEIKRNQDLVEEMESAALLNGKELSTAARLMLEIGYRRVMWAKRQDRRALERVRKREEAKLKGFDPQHLTWLSHYVSKVDAEIDKICNDAKSIIDGHLIPYATSSEDLLSYHRLLGDLYRYRCDIKSGDGWKEAALDSSNEYERAEVFAGKVPGNSPLRLRLALSFSTLCSKVLDDPKRARDIINKAVGAALSWHEELDATCNELVKKLKSMRDEILQLEVMKLQKQMVKMHADS